MGSEAIPVDRDRFQRLLTAKVVEVSNQPEYRWGNAFRSFMTDEEGEPVVRVGITDCLPEMDIWEGLRTPAHVGMYPLGLRDIWMHYAAAHLRSTRHDGSPNPLAMPETYDEALEWIGRAVIVSGMLAINPAVFEVYAEKIERGDPDPLDYYCRATGEVSAIIDRAVGRFALTLVAPRRAVIPMTKDSTKAIIERTRSAYLDGRYHGPCNNHWPQNSVAVMTDLMRFGVNRLPFLDERGSDASVRRLYGRYYSIVIFDEETPVNDTHSGITLLDSERLSWLRRMNDYTDTAPALAAERYCSYNLTKPDGVSVCGRCIRGMPFRCAA